MRFLSTLLNRRKSEPTPRPNPEAGIRATRTVVWGDDPQVPIWMRSKSRVTKAIQFPLSKRPSLLQMEPCNVTTLESVQKACSKRWDDIQNDKTDRHLCRFSFESLTGQSVLSSSPKEQLKYPHISDFPHFISEAVNVEMLEESCLNNTDCSYSSDSSRPPSSSERPPAPTPSHGHRLSSSDFPYLPISTPVLEYVDESSETSSIISAINAASTSDEDDPVTPNGSPFYQTSNILINPHVDGEIVTYSAVAGGRFVRERIRDGQVLEREVIEKGFI